MQIPDTTSEPEPGSDSPPEILNGIELGDESQIILPHFALVVLVEP